MKINQLRLFNFRSKEELQIELGSRLTLLLGENGSGKTTVLDAMAIALGAILTHLPKVSGKSFKRSDLMLKEGKQMPYTRVEIQTDQGLKWSRTDRRDKSEKTTSLIPPARGLQSLRRFLDETIIHPFLDDQDFQLPVFSYYGVSRALLDVPLTRKGFPKTHHRFEAYENALEATTRFKSAFVWFYNKENEEQRKQKELRSFEYKLPELEAVRQAILRIFPDISEPHIMVNPLRFAVKKDGLVLDIAQLSDGYKTLISLVIDLASRMALANPAEVNPLDSPGIVMIDEVDLHLHPEWQSRVVGDLLKVFRNTQFIITTHSPYIVEALNLHLQRSKIGGLKIVDRTIRDILPLSPGETRAYMLTSMEIVSLIDEHIQLVDDKLLHPYNKISELYDRMRDLEWEHHD